jgi:uncharacterized protein YukE
VGGSYRGTAVPPVGGISYHGYTPPANWQDPAVSGKDLMVHRDVLREVASQISALAGELQGVISAWQGNAASAASSGAVGAWPEAQQLAEVIGRSHSGFGQYSGDLRQAHNDTATRITISAERYDATEQANVSLAIASHDPSAVIVESGGNNVPVDPGYGKNWTPQQREAYTRTQRLINMNDGGEVWNGTFEISAAAGFSQAGTAGYTWEQVQNLLAGTDPGAISAAGSAYGQLAGKLTEVASKVAGLGSTLAGSWGGSTALTAVSQVQQLYQTASDMQANAWQAQHALTWYGSVLGAFKANLPQPATAHPADVAAANQAAQQRMAALNGHLQTAYYAMPGAVNKNLPPKLAGKGGGAPPTSATAASGSGGPAFSGAGGGGGGGAGAGSGLGAPGGTGSPPGAAGGFPPPGIAPAPGGGTPPGSQLAGSGPGGGAPGGGGGPAPAGAPGGTTPGGPAGGVVPPGSGGGAPGEDGVPPGERTVPGGGAIPPGEGMAPGGTGVPPGEGTVPGETGVPPGEGAVPGGNGIPGGGRLASLPGEDPVPAGGGVAPGEPAGSVSGVPPAGGMPGEPGAPGEPGSSLAAGDEAGALRMEGGMFPMTGSPGGGAGAGGFDRARQSWTTEDDGTWGADGGGLGAAGEAGDGFFMPVGPGDGGGRGGGRGDRTRDRARQAWLAEDDDLWGAAEPAVPPVIGR